MQFNVCVYFCAQSTQETVENLNHTKADLEKVVAKWVIWLIDWLIDQSIDRLIDWLVVLKGM